jgi:hypothetical protein
MSTDIVDEPLSESFDFCDAQNEIIVTLYAHGAFEVKDIDISIETDSLDVRTPGKIIELIFIFNNLISYS